MLYVNAKRNLDKVVQIFEQYGFPFREDMSVLPNIDDNSTHFMCSGMQRYINKFSNPDGSNISSIQNCIRTNDIDLVGDGSHLTYFQMLGNFSFRGIEYKDSIEMWNNIITELNIPITTVHIHPQSGHKELWTKYKYDIIYDDDCVWSANDIGGYCSEMYYKDLEVGNLVNTLGHSTDVGFGWERIVQVLENKNRIDTTSLFRQDLSPVLRDHVRTLEVFWKNNIQPHNKGRGYIVRKMLRRILNNNLCDMLFQEWLESEKEYLDRKLQNGRKFKDKYSDKSDQWWWDSFGITSEERKLL